MIKSAKFFWSISPLLFSCFTSSSFTQEINSLTNYSTTVNGYSRTDGKKDDNSVLVFKKSPETELLEKEIYNMRKSGSLDISKTYELQKQIDNLTGLSVTEPASFYGGNITPSSIMEKFDAVGNSLVLQKNGIKAIVTSTEYSGATAGRIWTVIGFQGTGSTSTPDSIRVLYSSDNGINWTSYANITLANTDKINVGDMDVELIEGGTNKYLHIVFGLRANGGSGKWFAAGASIQLTGTFTGNLWTFNWPGTDDIKRYYFPRITSDNVVWTTAPWVYFAVSFDSAGATGRVNTQKYAQLNAPNTVNPVITYKASKIYWYNETPNQQTLFTDIAFYQRNFADSLIISFCGVPDSTKVFFSKMSAASSQISPSNQGQYIGPVGGSESNLTKYGGRLSSNENSNGSVFFIFYQKGISSDGIKYFRTTNYGDFNSYNQSIVWTAENGVSFPDIKGVRNGNTHKFGFFFRNSFSDSLKYVSVASDGTFYTSSDKMNSVNIGTTDFPPAVGSRFVPNDSCIVLFSGSRSSNVYSAYGCSGLITGITNYETPYDFGLKQNFPNPFNPVTKISYSVSVKGLVTLKVYDLVGREVSTLVNEVKNPGYYQIDFNAAPYASGVYFYKLFSGNFSDTKKMILLK